MFDLTLYYIRKIFQGHLAVVFCRNIISMGLFNNSQLWDQLNPAITDVLELYAILPVLWTF